MTTPELFPCDKCQTLTDINLLDAKDDGTGNFTILECRACYGPGWVPAIDPTGEFQFISGGDDDD